MESSPVASPPEVGREGRLAVPYPNASQWLIIWTAAILIFTGGDPQFFASLGGYDAWSNWLWPEVTGYEDRSRLGIAVCVAAILLVWHFSRTVKIRSPILLPLGFVSICLTWYLVGVLAYYGSERPALPAASEVVDSYVPPNGTRRNPLIDEILSQLPPIRDRQPGQTPKK